MSIISFGAEQMRRLLLREGSLVFEVKVIPRARSAEVSGAMANRILKVKVRAAPERGRANEELCAVVAEYLAVPKSEVEVISGHTSQQKRIRVVL